MPSNDLTGTTVKTTRATVCPQSRTQIPEGVTFVAGARTSCGRGITGRIPILYAGKGGHKECLVPVSDIVPA